MNLGTWNKKWNEIRVDMLTVIWKGTIQEWKEKIQNLYTYVNPSYPLYPMKKAYELLIQ